MNMPLRVNPSEPLEPSLDEIVELLSCVRVGSKMEVPPLEAGWARVATQVEHAKAVRRVDVGSESNAHVRSMKVLVGERRPWGHRLSGKHFLRRGIVTGAIGALIYAAFATGPDWLPASRVRSSPIVREYVTRTAQRLAMTLPDGSRAMLAPMSRVRYTLTSDGTRQLLVDGEAYFTVIPDQRRPFTVRAGSATVRVLGTAFGVRHYATDTDVQIAVTEGKILAGVQRTSRARILTAGHVAYVRDSTIDVRGSGSAADMVAWTNGKLVFTDTPVPAMLKMLGRWSGYEFKLADSSVAVGRVNATFSADDPARNMIALRDLLNVTMTFDRHVVTLHARRNTNGAAQPSGRRDASAPLTTHPEQGK
jgi:transmembrane sensor